MSFRDATARANIDVEVHDSGVDARLANIDAKYEAFVRSVGRKEALIKIKGDSASLTRSIDEAKRKLKELEAEQLKQNSILKNNTGIIQQQARARLAAANSQHRAVLQSLRDDQTQLDSLNKQRAAIIEIGRTESALESIRAANFSRQQQRSRITSQSDSSRLSTEQKLWQLQNDIGRNDISGLRKLSNWALHWNQQAPKANKEIDDLDSHFKTLAKSLGGISTNLGPFNANLGGLFAAMTAGAPIVASLAGALGSLVSVLGAGLAGAAGLGGAALAGFGLAAIGLKADLTPILQQLTTVHSAFQTYQADLMKYGAPTTTTKVSTSGASSAATAAAAIPVDQQKVAYAQQAYNHVLAQYGKSSMAAQAASIRLASAQNTLASAERTASGATQSSTTSTNQSQKAMMRYQQALKSLPQPIRSAVQAFYQLRLEWTQLTQRNALSNFANMMKAGVATAQTSIHWFAKDTNTAFNDIRAGWDRWMKAIQNPDTQKMLNTIFVNFDRSIRPLMSGIGHLAGAFTDWFATMSKFLPSIAKKFDSWAASVDGSARASDGWLNASKTMISALKELGRFAIATAKWLFALFAPGVQPGNSLLDHMTNSLNKTAKAMRTLEGQKDLRDFYQQSVIGARQLWNALKPLAEIFFVLVKAFTPIAVVAVKFVTWITNATAAVFKLIGPFGDLIRDALGLVVALRLLGKISTIGPLVKTFQSLRNAVGAVLTSVKLLFAEGPGAAWANLKTGFKGAGASAGAQLEEAMNAGTAAQRAMLEEEGTVLAAKMRAALIEGGKVASGELTAGEVAGGGAAAAEARAAGVSSAVPVAEGGVAAATVAPEAAAFGAGSWLTRGSAVVKLLAPLAAVIGIGNALFGSGGGGGFMGALSQGLSSLSLSLVSPQKTRSALDTVGAGLNAVENALPNLANDIAGINNTTPASKKELRDTIQQIASWSRTQLVGAKDQLTALEHEGKLTVEQADVLKKLVDARRQQLANLQKEVANAVSNPVAQQRSGISSLKGRITSAIRAGTLGGPASGALQIEQGIINQFQGLAPKLQDAGAQAMISFTAGLERQGKVAKGTTNDLIKGLEFMYGAPLKNALERNGMNSMKAITDSVRGSHILDATRTLVKQMQNEWVGMPKQPILTTKNFVSTVGSEMNYLRTQMGSSNAKTAAEAAAAFKKLRDQCVAFFGNMVTQVGDKQNSLAQAIARGSSSAGSVATHNFDTMKRNIVDAVNKGLLGSQQGAKLLSDALNATLGAFGQPHIPINLNIKAVQVGAAIAGGFSSSVPNQGFGLHATGGRVPGQVGPDNWTLVDPTGRPAGKVGGGEILIANRHTEDRVDSMLSFFGTSLDHEVHSEHMPHSAYAKGGRAKKFAAGGRAGWQNVVASAESLGGLGYQSNPISPYGYSELGVPPTAANVGTALGSLPYQTHMRIRAGNREVVAAKQDIGTGSSFDPVMGLYPGTVAQLGLSGGEFHVSIERADGAPLTVGSALGALAGLLAPKVSGGSKAMRGITQGFLNKMTAGGNKKLQKIAQRVGAAVTGTGYGTVTPSAHGAYAALVPERTDQGVDFGGAGPVGAVLPGVVMSSSIWPGWPGTGGIVYRTAHGNVYIMEDFTPSVGAGRSVRPGMVIGMATGGPTGIETGWANSAGSGPLTPYNGAADGTPMPGGIAFRHFIGYKRGGRVRYNKGGRAQPRTRANRATPARSNTPRHNSTYKPPSKSSHSTSHSTSNTSIPLNPNEVTDIARIKWLEQLWAAEDTYNNYKARLKREYQAHTVGTPGHWDKSGTSWIKSTVHVTGAVPKSDKLTLYRYAQKVQAIEKEHPKWQVKNPFSTVWDIPAKDRIGGIGTADIDALKTALQGELSSYASHISTNYDPKTGTSVPATKAQKEHETQIKRTLGAVDRKDKEAKAAIAEFQHVENVIASLNATMNLASQNPSGMARGLDPGKPGSHRSKGPGKMTTMSWSGWKRLTTKWDEMHLDRLQKAYRDLKKRFGPKPSKFERAWLDTMYGSLQTAQSDYSSLRATASPASQESMDTYIANLDKLSGFRDRMRYTDRRPHKAPWGKEPKPGKELQWLQYVYALDQNSIRPDDPNTPMREDIVSSIPAMRDAEAIYDFYNSLLRTAQKDPKTRTNYQLLTQIAGAVSSARSEYHQYADAKKSAKTATGPTQLQLFDTAREQMFAQYASNVAPFRAPAGAAGAAAAATIFASTNPASIPAAAAPPPGASTTVNVTNNYGSGPVDPHSWSQGLAWELQAAV